MSAIIEYPDLESLKMAITCKDNYIVTDLNMNTTDTYAKANGYKIFWVIIDPDDPYFEPEDSHGDRIYTYLSNKLRDCKSVAIPIYDFTNAAGENKEEMVSHFIKAYKSSDPFQVYVGNGYLNILANKNTLDLFHNEEYRYFGSSIGFILISDGMYKNRSNALDKLLNLTTIEGQTISGPSQHKIKFL